MSIFKYFKLGKRACDLNGTQRHTLHKCFLCQDRDSPIGFRLRPCSDPSDQIRPSSASAPAPGSDVLLEADEHDSPVRTADEGSPEDTPVCWVPQCLVLLSKQPYFLALKLCLSRYLRGPLLPSIFTFLSPLISLISFFAQLSVSNAFSPFLCRICLLLVVDLQKSF